MHQLISLWTIQTNAAWDAALARGRLKGDGRRVPTYWRPAYHWMMNQMAERLPAYKGGFPIWCWQQRPDLRRSGHLPSGTNAVLINFHAGKESALITDFELWHLILNGAELSAEELGLMFDPQPHESQAVVEAVEMSQVRSVRFFTAR